MVRFRLVFLKLVILGGFVFDSPAQAETNGTVLTPVSERFAKTDVAEVPSLQRHVLPLLGRLGCNGRACHGSFQGQGGFRLSLFGYDFKADHEALLGGEKPRVNVKDPAASLILRKPTLTIDHEGGERYKKGGWEHHLLAQWIEGGAPPVSEKAAELLKIELEPQEILFSAPGEKRQLKVVSFWSDGTQEDVTCLTRFRTNDESIAQISEAGVVTSVAKGDTHVVAFYDNGTMSAAVGLPLSDLLGPRYPS